MIAAKSALFTIDTIWQITKMQKEYIKHSQKHRKGRQQEGRI